MNRPIGPGERNLLASGLTFQFDQFVQNRAVVGERQNCRSEDCDSTVTVSVRAPSSKDHVHPAHLVDADRHGGLDEPLEALSDTLMFSDAVTVERLRLLN